VSTAAATAAALCYRKWRHNRKWRRSRDRKWPITGSDVSHVTGSDVISPRFFLTIVVVQNVPLLFIIRFTVSDYSFGIIWSLCCLSFDLRLLIIRLVSSSFPCKGTFCTTTIVRKKARGKLRHFRSRTWRHFRIWVTSGHETDVTSGYDGTSGHVTDVTSGYDVTSGGTEQQQ
jgi:hypothetical protein